MFECQHTSDCSLCFLCATAVSSLCFEDYIKAIKKEEVRRRRRSLDKSNVDVKPWTSVQRVKCLMWFVPVMYTKG